MREKSRGLDLQDYRGKMGRPWKGRVFGMHLRVDDMEVPNQDSLEPRRIDLSRNMDERRVSRYCTECTAWIRSRTASPSDK